MSIVQESTTSFTRTGFSRRQIGRFVALFAAGSAFPAEHEFAQAAQAEIEMLGPLTVGPDTVRISSNENPMGPAPEALEMIYKIAKYGWRYRPFGETGTFEQTVAEIEGVKPEYVMAFAGSSDPLSRTGWAYTSRSRSWVMANPSFGGRAPVYAGAQVIGVPTRPDHTHDVEAMIKADPNAGVYYVCNPNNPTGVNTPRKDIEYLLAHKKPYAVVVVDEAYIHFSESAVSCSDLVAADKDVVILRTFSKLYGMAGLRAGMAIGRPDLLAMLAPYGSGSLPITGIAGGIASLKSKNLVKERRALNRQIREDTLEHLEKKGIKYIPSETNFFMMEVGRPGAEFARDMAKQKVIIGRTWPIYPTMSRVTVGTKEEMMKFTAAVDKVMGV